MRKIVVTEFVTLDGVMEAPNTWSFQFWTEEIAKVKFNELFASDALLLGRVTYEGFAAAWPAMARDEAGFADRMNGLPKFVASRSLTQAAWNNSTLIRGPLAEDVSKLKQAPGQDILIEGSSDLIQALRPYDLIDEYRLLVYPVVLGTGKRLFKDGSRASLKLAETRSFSCGVVLLHYRVERKG